MDTIDEIIDLTVIGKKSEAERAVLRSVFNAGRAYQIGRHAILGSKLTVQQRKLTEGEE